MGIDERIRQRRSQRDELAEVHAASDVLLVLTAAAATSVLLPIRSQHQNLGNLPVVITLLALLSASIVLSVLALSNWDATDYGLGLGVGTLAITSFVFLRFGSWRTFWTILVVLAVVTAVWHIWIGYRARDFSASDVVASDRTGAVLSSDVASFVVVAVSGLLVYRLGTWLSPLMRHAGDLYTLTPVVGLLVVGYTVLRQIDVVADSTVSAVLVVCVGAWIYASFLTQPEARQFGTDAILFAEYSANLVLEGANPYAHSMRPAFDRYPIDLRFVTYRVDGSIVLSYSYPGASILLFTAGELLGIPNLNWVALLFLFGTLGFLVTEARGAYKFASVGILLASHDYFMFTAGGVFDVMYVFFLLLGMKFWADESYRLSALLVGFSFAIKQVPWLIGPYLAVWLYRTSPTPGEFRRHVRDTIGFGMFGFLLPNLPFAVTAPVEWLEGIVTPIAGGAPLTMQGIALSSLVTHDLFYLPRSYFVALVVLVYAASVALYFLWFDELKWAAWVLPTVVYFVHYRSLLNYFVFAPVIAYYAVLLKHDLTADSSARAWLSGVRERVAA